MSVVTPLDLFAVIVNKAFSVSVIHAKVIRMSFSRILALKLHYVNFEHK